MKTTKVAEFAFDLHAGLSAFQVPDFDDLHKVGMAATLAIHIKGLGEIPYETLRNVSDHFMGIPSIALEPVLRILADAGFVSLSESGKKITKVTATIPVFETVYTTLGDWAESECVFNEHEQATLLLLEALETAPRNRDWVTNSLGISKPVLDRTLELNSKAGIVNSHLARGRSILISPFYFADNLDGLADAAASVGASAMQSTLKKLKRNQGWPLSLVNRNKEIGGSKLNSTELALVQKLAAEGVIKPPKITFGEASESFVFTPKPGNTRLNAANREVYERAMALVSAVRKGQLLPSKYRIKWPVLILEKLRDRGWIGSNSEAPTQYLNLVYLRVGTLRRAGSDSARFYLNRTPENEAALALAIKLLQTGSMAGLEVDSEARIALTKDERYVQTLISARELRERQKPVVDEQATYEYEQLLLKL